MNKHLSDSYWVQDKQELLAYQLILNFKWCSYISPDSLVFYTELRHGKEISAASVTIKRLTL